MNVPQWLEPLIPEAGRFKKRNDVAGSRLDKSQMPTSLRLFRQALNAIEQIYT